MQKAQSNSDRRIGCTSQQVKRAIYLRQFDTVFPNKSDNMLYLNHVVHANDSEEKQKIYEKRYGAPNRFLVLHYDY